MCKCGRIPPQKKKHFLEILANCFFFRERIYGLLIEISAKSGKESTSTLSVVIKRVRFKKKKNLQNIHLKDRKPSIVSCLSFFFMSDSTAATYIFTSPTCTATIIPLEPCALSAEFQHFIPRFNKISLLYGYH
jgi:hypothetical protein